MYLHNMSSITSVIKSARAAYIAANESAIRHFTVGASYSIHRKTDTATAQFEGFYISTWYGNSKVSVEHILEEDLFNGNLLHLNGRLNGKYGECLVMRFTHNKKGRKPIDITWEDLFFGVEISRADEGLIEVPHTDETTQVVTK